jgi:hypothetical protein
MSETRDTYRPPVRVGLSALSLLFASVVAIVTFFHFDGGLFCNSMRSRGDNIVHACAVAVLAGPVGSLLLLFARKRRRVLAVVLLLGASTLGVAIVLISLDRATYVAHQSCGFMTDESEKTFNDRVYYLYFLWGAPLCFLLWAATRALQGRVASSSSDSIQHPTP